MMGRQWHQLDHMQTICTSLQTDNHASTSSHYKALYAIQMSCLLYLITTLLTLQSIQARQFPLDVNY